MNRAATFLFGVTIFLAAAGTAVVVVMYKRVRARMPKGQNVRMFGFDQNAILGAHSKLFPGSRLVHVYWSLLVAMFVAFLSTAWALGLFR